MDTLLEPNVEFNEGTDDMDFSLDWKDGFVDTPVLPSTISSVNPLTAWNSFAAATTTNPGPSNNGKGSKNSTNNKSHTTTPKIPSNNKSKRKKQPSKASTLNESPDSNSTSGGLGPTRIRRQYNCESCSFRTINPREFLYHRRDVHGAKVKIVECPYCVYACQYFQKLQRHILLVHKLETITTPPSTLTTNVNSSGNIHNNNSSSDNKKLHNPSNDVAFRLNPTSKAASSKQVIKKSQAASTNQTILKTHVYHENDEDDDSDHALVMDESDVDELNAIQDDEDVLGELIAQNAIHEETPNGQITKCRACGYSTDVLALFKAHVSDHSAPKNKCDQCDFESAFAFLLDQHVAKNHSLLQNESAQNASQLNNSKSSSYTCTKCGFITDSPQLRSQHITQCHSRDSNDEDDNLSTTDSNKNVDENNDATMSTPEVTHVSKGL